MSELMKMKFRAAAPSGSMYDQIHSKGFYRGIDVAQEVLAASFSEDNEVAQRIADVLNCIELEHVQD